MNKKAIISIILVLAFIATAGILPISAVDEGATVVIEKTTFTSGTGTVTISVTSDKKVYGGNFILVYDKELLTCYHFHNWDSTTFQVNNNYMPGKIKVAFASGSEISGKLMTFYFELKVNRQCTTEISFESINLYDENGSSIKTTANPTVCDIKPQIAINSVSFAKKTLNLAVGKTEKPILTYDPTDATVNSESWSSSNTSVATVSEDGTITAKGVGSSVIMCRALGTNGSFITRCTVYVYRTPVMEIEDVKVAKDASFSLKVKLDTSGNEITAGSLNILYGDELELTGIDKGDLLDTSAFTVNEKYKANTARVNFASSLPIDGKGNFFVLNFKALKSGNASISFDNIDLFTESNITYTAEFEQASIEIGDARLVLGDFSGYVKHNITVPVSYASEKKVSGGSFIINYDPLKLKFNEFKQGDVQTQLVVNPEYGNGQIKISFAGTEEFGNADFGDLVFTSLVSTAYDTSVSLNSVSMYNLSGEKSAPAEISSTVSLNTDEEKAVHVWNASIITKPATAEQEGIKKYTCTLCGYEKTEIIEKITHIIGDVDNNEKVDSDDAIYLLYYTLIPDLYPVMQPCDFDKNGITDSDDAIYLLYYTLLPELYPIQ